MDVDCMLQL